MSNQPIITLTTDFGDEDYYVGALKGYLFSMHRDATIVDITHSIKPYDLRKASFVLRNAAPTFPKGTIHLIHVESEVLASHNFLVTEHQGHYYLAPDNGMLPMAFPGIPLNCFMLPMPEGSIYLNPTRDCLAAAACRLFEGATPEEIGEVGEMQTIPLPRPAVTENSIRGQVDYIDRYSNVMLNVTRELFIEVAQSREFKIHVRTRDVISRISNYYTDVKEGHLLCLFNSDGYLEIAMHQGKAAQLFGFKVGDPVRIEFEPSNVEV